MRGGIENRPFTEHTRWIICMWYIRGFSPENIAADLRRSLRVVAETIIQAQNDGYYERVREYLEEFDRKTAQDWYGRRGAL